MTGKSAFLGGEEVSISATHRNLLRETLKQDMFSEIHPPKQTWNLKMDPWKRRFLLETIISRFHVNFWGCIQTLTCPQNHLLDPHGPINGVTSEPLLMAENPWASLG